MSSYYSKPTEVQAYYIGLDFTDAAYMQEARVKKWIQEASVQVDMYLRRKYVLPITDADDLVALKLLTEKYVVGKIDKIIRTTSSDENEKEYIRDRNYSKEFQSDIQSLTDGEFQLVTPPKNLAPIRYINNTGGCQCD